MHEISRYICNVLDKIKENSASFDAILHSRIEMQSYEAQLWARLIMLLMLLWYGTINK